MTLSSYVHFGAALFCGGLACLGLLRDHRSFVHRLFVFGMIVLGLESLFTGLSVQATLTEEVIRWQQWRSIAAAFLPGSWLIFTVSLARADHKPLLRGWKWIGLGTFLLHLSFVTIFAADFFGDIALFDPSHKWLLPLGWSGYVFYVCFLVSVVCIIVFLENTIRSLRGRKRWQVKFLALGIGGLFAVRVYTGSQALLLHQLNSELEVVNGATLLVANLLILVSLFRGQFLQADIYLSQGLLYKSFTLFIVGTYLLALGVFAKATGHVQSGLVLALRAFLIFLAVTGLMIVFLSDSLRLKMKRHISRHFRRPRYDYRNAWIAFTKRTASLVEKRAFCDALVRMISEMLDIPSVSLWLLSERKASISLGGSTVFSDTQARDLPGFRNGASDLVQLMRNQRTFVDLEGLEVATAEDFKGLRVSFWKEARIRYCIPVVTGADLLGIITVGNRVGGEPVTLEELDILKTMADQVAASLLNLKLSKQIQQAKEMEAFQTMAAFFVHDLKNLASRVSLLLQNLPIHFDNPAFREDALHSMSESLEKINSMWRRLSVLKEGLELRPTEVDLNNVVTTTLASLNGILDGHLVEKLHPIPRLSLDRKQIQKVLTNLILNANEAIGDGGKIHVSTGTRDGWVVLTVRDNGCGISKEFLDQYLFRPFRTTKKQGTGIGLFQTKMIVDAHKGQMEVESEQGRGSSFHILLPLRRNE
ncbi:MAG TPA: PEP-CTERM system histidine kinase PrsK [Desulfobacterales bacterium]|nr:PEP-CTERM system histidine kinase PrsK [Desulfobacterales bacterium]